MNEWMTLGNGQQQGRDTCALRLSYDLNLSGVSIPKGDGTVSGADKQQYYLQLPKLEGFLTSAFGKPTILPGGSFAGPEGKTGILMFKVAFGSYGPAGPSSGHGTLWNGSAVRDPDSNYRGWPAPYKTLFWEVK